MNERYHSTTGGVTRRDLLRQAAGVVAAGGAAAMMGGRLDAAPSGPAITRGRIKQSIAYWCFNIAGEEWDLETQCRIAKQLGCGSVELVDPKDFPILKKHGLISAMTLNGMPGVPFVKGLNNLNYHEEIITRTKLAMDTVAEAGFPSVIAFNGFKWRDAEDPNSGEIPLDEGARNCVTGLKKLASYAEKTKVDVCMEMLNTRDDSHPMKGHPGFQGDHMDYVAEIVKQVGSPRVKILFDIYHVQVMDGDVIRRIRQYADLIGHVHTAGNPGRNELDGPRQEINYPACMEALLEVGYTGYVGQEFLPTRDPLDGLTQAVKLCAV